MQKKILIGCIALGVVVLVGAGRMALAGEKVRVCHNPGRNGHVIEVSENALGSHLGHGDFETSAPAGSACSRGSSSAAGN